MRWRWPGCGWDTSIGRSTPARTLSWRIGRPSRSSGRWRAPIPRASSTGGTRRTPTTGLGEALRRVGGRYLEAKAAYDAALMLQRSLEQADAAHRQAVARTLYNRGILFAEYAGREGATLEAAETDLRAAIRLLEPLAAASAPLAAQELARAYNNLGSVVAETPAGRSASAVRARGGHP